MKTPTFLPVFTGFYGTVFESIIKDAEDRFIENNKDTDSVDFNYKKINAEICKEIHFIIERKLQSLKMIRGLIFEGIYSPHEYNFSNDSLNTEVEFTAENIQNILTYLHKNKDKFSAYLKARYTSCDGFLSSHSNKTEDWINAEALQDSHQSGAILDFVLKNEDYNEIDLYYDLSETYFELEKK